MHTGNFPYIYKNIRHDPSLEPCPQGGSYDGLGHMFLLRN